MKSKIVKCKNKINKLCNATGQECNHAVKHKKNKWCEILNKNSNTCKNSECIEIKEIYD